MNETQTTLVEKRKIELTKAERAYYKNPTDANLTVLKRAEFAYDGIVSSGTSIPYNRGNGLTFDGECSFEL